MIKSVVHTDLTLLNDIRTIIEQGRAERAVYGDYLLKTLAEQLTAEFGQGFNKRSLEKYRQFYLSFKDLEIAPARGRNLTWTHYKIIMREPNPAGREWYVREASEQMWSTR